jgi:hypothetical protein
MIKKEESLGSILLEVWVVFYLRAEYKEKHGVWNPIWSLHFRTIIEPRLCHVKILSNKAPT